MAQGLSTFFFYYIVGDLALLRRSKGSIASKAWEDRTVAAMSSPGTLMFLSATPSRMRQGAPRPPKRLALLLDQVALQTPARLQVLQQGLHHLLVLSLPHPHENFALRVFSLRKLGTVGITSASGVDPAGALAAFTSCSCMFDNCGLLSASISPSPYSMTTGTTMSIHLCNDFSQAQSLTRGVCLRIGQNARPKRRKRIGKRPPRETAFPPPRRG
jgi:hypothetical protein